MRGVGLDTYLALEETSSLRGVRGSLQVLMLVRLELVAWNTLGSNAQCQRGQRGRE